MARPAKPKPQTRSKNDNTVSEPRRKEEISKIDSVLLALLLTGGAEKEVDIEDIAVAAFQLDPVSFRWTRYDYPDREVAHKALRHNKERYGERFLRSRSAVSTQRILTAEGIARAVHLATIYTGNKKLRTPQEAITALRRVLTEKPRVTGKPAEAAARTAPSAAVKHDLTSLKRHRVFREWKQGRLTRTMPWEIADLLQCLPDSPAAVWIDRLETYKAQATWWREDDIFRFLQALEKKLHHDLGVSE